jgi:hypothetical protein
MTTTTTIILKTRRLRGSMSVYSSSGGSPECMGQLDPVTHAMRWFVHRVLSKDLRSQPAGASAFESYAPVAAPVSSAQSCIHSCKRRRGPGGCAGRWGPGWASERNN